MTFRWRVRYLVRGPKAALVALWYDHEPSDAEIQEDRERLGAEDCTVIPPTGFRRI